MKAILKSLVVIGLVGAVTIGATRAFFSDVETSTGNTFTAGGLDLKVNNTCYINGASCPEPTGIETTWTESDLVPGVHKFFYFTDLKPGDHGEDTVSLHVYNNDAWGRLKIDKLVDQDVDCTEPETESTDPECIITPTPIPGDGELRENLRFWVWLDQGSMSGFQGVGDTEEGDNIYQPNEPMLITPGTIDEGGETWEFAQGLLGNSDGLTGDGHMVGSVTYYFGIGWCLGEVDGGVCDGSGIGDEVQTDTFGGDMTIEIVQYRNNPTPWPTP